MSKFPHQLLKSPSGFPDLGPAAAIAQRHMLDVIKRHYELAGYVPIETPLVERPQVLFAKAEGEIKNQVYGLRRLNIAADEVDDTKELALRFDQTVPLARFVAANHGTLAFPFRRYVIGPVFRGERPKDGRYRQFTQADIDVIGDGTLSILHDAEMVSVIYGIFTELAIGSFTVRIGNRKVLQGLLEAVGVTSPELVTKASGAIDRLDKIGREAVVMLLQELGIVESDARDLLALLTETRLTDETLALLKEKQFNALFDEGVQELVDVVAAVRSLGVPEDCFRVDISIARGLEYYTGTVYETQLNAYPDLGSIASGGRYDNLTGVFADRNLPGVGISIGVTRLLLRLIKVGLLPAIATTIAPVLVATPAGLQESAYLEYARRLRAAGIPTEIYFTERSLGKQMQFADRRGFTVVVIARAEQIASGEVTVRNLKTGKEETCPKSLLVDVVQMLLNDKA